MCEPSCEDDYPKGPSPTTIWNSTPNWYCKNANEDPHKAMASVVPEELHDAEEETDVYNS